MCCLGQNELGDHLWPIDTKNEIANLIDENVGDGLFYNLNIERDYKPRTFCYIHFAPCWLSIHTAARICENECWKGRDTSMTWRIRVDERLDPEYIHARTRLGEVLSSGEILQRNPLDQGWYLHADLNHVRRRLYALDKNDRDTSSEFRNKMNYDVGAILKEHRTTPSCVTIVVLTKAETYRAFDALLGYVSFPSLPKNNQIYEYRWNHDSPTTMREPIFLGI